MVSPRPWERRQVGCGAQGDDVVAIRAQGGPAKAGDSSNSRMSRLTETRCRSRYIHVGLIPLCYQRVASSGEQGIQ